MLNHVELMGRITKDPEMRRTQSGLAVASFGLAVERDYKDDQGNRETDFLNCVAWRSTAEYVQKYFPKGRACIATGRLQSRTYEDKNGQKRTVCEVIVDNIYPADYSKPKGADGQQGQGGGYQGGYQEAGYQSGSYQAQQPQPGEFIPMDDDDNTLPF